ncbi:MAG: 50S ribosomal protein L21e [Nanoarchaeota archaeon]|mgnify:CR=1 FL=1
MSKKKAVRTRGKLKLSRYFQELKKGDFVGVMIEPSLVSNIPKRLQGRTGLVDGKKGRAYIIKIKDMEKEKEFIINPIHLKKINYSTKR